MGVSHTQWPPSITRAILACLWFAQGLHRNQKSKQQSHSCVTAVCTGFHRVQKIKTAEPFLSDCGLHRASCQIKTASKGIIRKECQSFTNHGHAKTPPTVFNLPSLWLTLPRNMGVSHTVWPPNIARAILACLWFAQGLHKAQKNKTAEPFYDVQGDSMYSIISVDATYFFSTLSPLEIVPFATFYHLQKYLRGTCFSKKRLFQVDSALLS